ncbi:MAG: hypothetical protein ACKO38_20955, partial [Planctomycetota bacterium]
MPQETDEIIAAEAVRSDPTSSTSLPLAGEPPVRLFAAEFLWPTETPPVAEAIYAAEVIEERVELVAERSLLGRTRDRVASALEWLFGLASLFAGLAVLATFPVVQLLSLGYLL